MEKLCSPWEKLTLARRSDRPTAGEYINIIFENFIELHGDRYYGDDKAVMGGVASLKGIPVTVVAIQKGKNLKENIERNFGMPKPEGYRKALRLVKQAEKFNRPVVLFIDTPGAYCGIESEERGQGEAIASNLMELASISTPMISIITGEGGSGGALALALTDRVWMLENSIYSILSPEGFASILWKDARRSKEAAEIMKITAEDLYKMKVIDKIIAEPEGGAQADPKAVAEKLKEELYHEFGELKVLDSDTLLKHRYDKFRNIDSEFLNN